MFLPISLDRLSKAPMDTGIQLLSSGAVGIVFFVILVGHRYWIRLSWALAPWDAKLATNPRMR